MELQVRVAYETAEMLEQLKEYYERKSGVKYSKGEVYQGQFLILMIYGMKSNGPTLKLK